MTIIIIIIIIIIAITITITSTIAITSTIGITIIRLAELCSASRVEEIGPRVLVYSSG